MREHADRISLDAHHVRGVFHDARTARGAIERLEWHGIDGDAIELAGPGAREGAEVGDLDEREAREQRLVHRVVRGIGAGAVVGVVAGVVVGAVVVLAVRWAFGTEAVAVWVGVLGGAILGGACGAFVEGERSVGLSDSWEVTFADPPDEVVVVVHVGSPEAARVAVDALSGGSGHRPGADAPEVVVEPGHDDPRGTRPRRLGPPADAGSRDSASRHLRRQW